MLYSTGPLLLFLLLVDALQSLVNKIVQQLHLKEHEQILKNALNYVTRQTLSSFVFNLLAVDAGRALDQQCCLGKVQLSFFSVKCDAHLLQLESGQGGGLNNKHN